METIMPPHEKRLEEMKEKLKFWEEVLEGCSLSEEEDDCNEQIDFLVQQIDEHKHIHK